MPCSPIKKLSVSFFSSHFYPALRELGSVRSHDPSDFSLFGDSDTRRAVQSTDSKRPNYPIDASMRFGSLDPGEFKEPRFGVWSDDLINVICQMGGSPRIRSSDFQSTKLGVPVEQSRVAFQRQKAQAIDI
ncbi:hypothetical protein ACLOJK_033978 [Asimina triloba]